MDFGSDIASTSTSASSGGGLQPNDGAAPKAKRPPRNALACVRCKSRKQRCDLLPDAPRGPCRNCSQFQVECVFLSRSEKKKDGSLESRDAARGRLPQASDMPTTGPNLPPIVGPSNWVSSSNAQGQFIAPRPPQQATSASGGASTSAAPFLVQPSGPSSSVHQTSVPAGTEHSAMDTRVHSPRHVAAYGRGRPDPGATPSSVAESGMSEESALSDEAARGVAFLSLNASGQPLYLGPSSGFSWSKVVMGSMAGAEMAQGRARAGTRPDVTHQSFSAAASAGGAPPLLPDDALDNVSPELAAVVLTSVYKHIQPRYPFLDWLQVHDWWNRRNEILKAASEPNASRETSTAAFFLWMLWALGARLTTKMSLPLAAPEAYYQKAMGHLDIILGLHDLKNVQALLLMIMFSLRSSEAPSVWFLVGIVVRLCISLGLHRELPPNKARHVPAYTLQLRRRLFWSSYLLDRMMAMSLGRPNNISDSDIDILLPLDCDCVDVAPSAPSLSAPRKLTSMTSSIHIIKLRIIESKIQKQAYRVDQLADEAPDALLREIDDWEQAIPPEASDSNCWGVPLCSHDWFALKACEARLYLLRPSSVDESSDLRLNKLVAKYSADSCELQKRLHQLPATAVSLESLRSIFLCGLTLLHAVRIDRNALPLSVLQRAIRACSNTIYSYSQSFSAAQSFHEVFEDLATIALDQITAPPPQAGTYQEPAAFTPVAPTDTWNSRLADISSVMSFDDDFGSLLAGLLPVDDIVPPDFSWPPVESVFGAGPSTLDNNEPFPFASVFDSNSYNPYGFGSL